MGGELPGQVIVETRRRGGADRNPRAVEQRPDRRQIPNLLRRAGILPIVRREDLRQIRADLALRTHMAIQLGAGREQMRRRTVAGDVEQRRPARQHRAHRIGVAAQVVLVRARRVQRLPAQPDDSDSLNNARLDQQRRRDIGDRPDRRHIEHLTVGRRQRPLDQIFRCRIEHRRVRIGHRPRRPAQHAIARLELQSFE